MTRPAWVCLALLMIVLSPEEARSQARVSGAALFESYDFDGGFAIGGTPQVAGVSQLSFPFTVTTPLGRWADLTVAGGFTRVELTPSGGTDRIEPVSGLTDTELRLAVQLIPGRLLVIANGAAATGQESLASEQAAILTLLVRDVMGFSTRSLGSGGHFGGGLAGAVQAGNLALGLAGTYTQFGTYEPVAGTSRRLEPAGELRLRAGLEGPVGSGAYLRLAGIFARRGEDRINGEAVVRSSSRFATYFSIDGRVGSARVLAYAYDLYRAGARLEGAALLPRANSIAGGLEITVPLARYTTVLPRVEYRRTDQAQSDRDMLERLGSTLRLGLDLRQRLAGTASLVVEANGLVGTLVGELDSASSGVGVSGYRIGARLEIGR